MNLQRAWQRVKANKAAAGIDDMSIDAFSSWAQQGGWLTCKTQLEQGNYQPKQSDESRLINLMAINAL